MSKTLFQRIIDRELPAKIVHDDERCIAIEDIRPQAPVHVLIIPKRPIPRVSDAADADEGALGHLLLVARDIARKLKLEGGFRIVINNGPDACESIPHLHLHLLARRQFGWPPGSGPATAATEPARRAPPHTTRGCPRRARSSGSRRGRRAAG